MQLHVELDVTILILYLQFGAMLDCRLLHSKQYHSLNAEHLNIFSSHIILKYFQRCGGGGGGGVGVTGLQFWNIREKSDANF